MKGKFLKPVVPMLLGLCLISPCVCQAGLNEKMGALNDALGALSDLFGTLAEDKAARDAEKAEREEQKRIRLEQQAQELYRHAEMGSADAQLDVANKYSIGYAGFPKDKELAFYWYCKSGEQGNSLAQRYAADMLVIGDGIEKDIPSAMYWYGQAVSKGDVDSMIKLGDLFFIGNGCEQNLDAAVALYSQAFENKHLNLLRDLKSKTNLRLGLCYAEGKGCDVDENQAIAMFFEVVNQKNKYDKTLYQVPVALNYYYLGYCYNEGIGCEKNYKLAVKYLKKAKKLCPDLSSYWVQKLDNNNLEKILLSKMIPYADKVLSGEK